MQHQSDPAFTTEDTIVAIVLSMQALGLDVLLSPDFQQKDVESLFARVDAIIDQAGSIDLVYDDITNAFEKNRDIVSSAASARAQRRAEADLDAATVANENQGAQAEHTDANWDRQYDWQDDYVDAYNSDDDQCGCYGAFGKDDDGDVRHYGLDCQYRS